MQVDEYKLVKENKELKGEMFCDFPYIKYIDINASIKIQK